MRRPSEFVVADIPGLIEGAHEGRGLGDIFLGHVEKCSVLLHLIDATEGDFLENYRVIKKEVGSSGEKLKDIPIIIGLNKIDAVDLEERILLRNELEAVCGQGVLLLSSISGEGVTEVLRALKMVIEKAKNKIEVIDEDKGEWKP